MTHDPDLPTIDRILAGEQSVYADLVNRYKSYVYTIAYKVVQSRADAEEVAQDSFVKAYHNLRNFHRESKFSTWLYRIAFNTAISHRRRAGQIFKASNRQSLHTGMKAKIVLNEQTNAGFWKRR